MTSEPMLLEPEIESLLREVAADPKSSLLRVPRARALPALYEDRPAAGPATAGLSLAEREILRVHRLEVAWLLRQVCLLKLVEGARSRLFVSSYLTGQEQRRPPSPPTLVDSYEHLSHAATDGDDLSFGVTLLSRAVADTATEDPSVLELAAASHRLHASNEARVLAGQDMAMNHLARSALYLLSSLSPVDPGTSLGISIWSTLGLVHLKLGRIDYALTAYQHASELGYTRPGPWMDRFSVSLQLGHIADARHSSEHLDDIIGQCDNAVEWYVDSRLQRRQEREWQPTREAARLTSLLRATLGPVGRRICDAFA